MYLYLHTYTYIYIYTHICVYECVDWYLHWALCLHLWCVYTCIYRWISRDSLDKVPYNLWAASHEAVSPLLELGVDPQKLPLYVCTYIYIHTHINSCVYIYVEYTYIYIYIYIYIFFLFICFYDIQIFLWMGLILVLIAWLLPCKAASCGGPATPIGPVLEDWPVSSCRSSDFKGRAPNREASDNHFPCHAYK